MIKKINDLSNTTSEALQKSVKALAILCDLIDTYNYMGQHPTKKEADKLSYDAVKILRYMDIASDYVFEIKKDLMQTQEELEILIDEAKANKTVSIEADQQAVNPVNKDFMQRVYSRIEKALTGSPEFMQMQSKCAEVISSNTALKEYDNLTSEIDAKREELCYMQGFNDALQLVKGADRCGR